MDRNTHLKQAFFTGAILVAGFGWFGGQSAAFFGLCLWFVVLLALWVASAFHLRRRVKRTDGMPAREITRNAFGFPVRIRGQVAGYPVVITGRGVEVDLSESGAEPDAGHRSTFIHTTLRALRWTDTKDAEPARVLYEGRVHRVELRQRRLQLTGGRGPLQPLIEAALTLVGASGRLRLVASTQGACPYCHQPASFREEAVQRCSACDALHHNCCWQEHGGCAVFGCERGPKREARSRAADAKDAG